MTHSIVNIAYKYVIATCILTGLFSCGPDDAEDAQPVSALITIENISNETTYTGQSGSITLAMAPGLYAVTTSAPTMVFTPGEAASADIEALAETGDPVALQTTLRADDRVRSAGLTGDRDNVNYKENPILPGTKTVLPITFYPGDKLAIAMMLGPSNDTFLGTRAEGIDLGSLEEGEVDISSGLLAWWDAGTEVNEPLGEGMYQPSSMAGTEAGEEESGVIQEATLGDAERDIALPQVSDVVRVTFTLQ